MELVNVEKSFGSHKVLDNINLSIEKGEFITFLGASGCGKTTLLRCIAGLEKVDGGKVYIDGRDITYEAPQKRNLGMIFQQSALFPTMTVYKNIAYGLKLQKISKSEIDKRVKEALELVEMEGQEHKYPAQLSGGEQQRIALARNLVLHPKVLLLDEPFSAIDAKLRKALQIKIKEIHKKLGMTSIFVTHDQDEAMRMSDRIYVIHDGKVEQSGTPKDIYLHPETLFVAGFIGHYNIIRADKMHEITGGKLAESSGMYAIRPESMCMSDTLWKECEKKDIVLEGEVIQSIIQGNLIRYTVMVKDQKLDVDMLFDNEKGYAPGMKVWIRFADSEVLYYA